jgi:N-acetylglucosamine kinase-like BadF-type ATPase
MNHYYIGIDGGGTKTEAVLIDHKGNVLARRMAGASNPNDVTLSVSCDVMESLVHELLADTDISLCENAVYMFGGIAGALNHRDTLVRDLRSRLPDVTAIDIGSDVVNLLSGTLPTGDGACIICGTGSACFLRRGSELIRIGGWGYLLDSAGSGYDIGRQALEAVLRAHDRRDPDTMLTELLAAHLGGEVHAKLSEIYEKGKPYIASCAPAVFEAAAKRDATAQAILMRNACALAEYIEAAWLWLCEGKEVAPDSIPVVMGGGISQHEAPMWSDLVASMVDDTVPATVQTTETPMVWGAIVEAIKLDPACENADFDALREQYLATRP